MIYVEYQYHRKSDGKVTECLTEFDTPLKAVRFIYSITGKKDYCYLGYSCDSMEETEEMNKRL